MWHPLPAAFPKLAVVSSPGLPMVRWIQQTHMWKAMTARDCAEDTSVICLLTGIDTPPLGKGFCNISFSKTRRNLLSWRVWLGRTTKAICKGAFCCSKEGWRQSCEMLRSICIWMKGSAIIYSFDKACIHWCLKFSCFFFPGSHGKRKQIIYRNNYFIECIYTVKPQLLNHSWAR